MSTEISLCKPVLGDTVLLQKDFGRGSGIIVDSDAVRYRVCWRDGGSTLSWHTRRELAILRLQYGLART